MASSRNDIVSEYYVMPTIGQFKVTITEKKHPYNSSKLLHTTLNVGGHYDKCVNITILPPEARDSKELKLSWAEIHKKQCTVDSQVIRGTATVEMVNLAFTIARGIAPYAEYVTLDDMSYFYCNTPKGEEKVTLPPFHIALYGKTWYEDKFKATMVNKADYAKYKECIKAINDDRLKPEIFNFGNDTVEEILLPLYKESKNWGEFFKLIAKHHPRDKCVLMYSWTERVIEMIFKELGGSKLYSGEKWVIDLNNIPKIHYYEIDKSYITLKGGSDDDYMEQYDRYRWVNYQDALDWKIGETLKKRKMKYTRKNKKSHRKTQRKEEMF
jgi:hypothetical protein